MIIDTLNAFADGQAVTVTADSNTIDLGSAGRDLSMADELYLAVQVDTTFTAGGSATMTVALTSSDSSTFASGNTVTTFATTVAVATLVAGYVIYRGRVSGMVSRYNKFTFTVATGPMTAGAISAFLTSGLQKTKQFAAPNQA